MLYRLYTEFIPLDEVANILMNRGLMSFSVTKQNGWWKGSPEDSLIVEIFDDKEERRAAVYSAAEEIRAYGHQDEVYVAEIPCKSVRAVTVSE